MYFTHYVFSRHFFRGWVAITFLIAWISTLVILLMPLYQGRHTLKMFLHYVCGSRGNDLVRKAPDEAASRASTMDSGVHGNGKSMLTEKRGGAVDVTAADDSSES